MLRCAEEELVSRASQVAWKCGMDDAEHWGLLGNVLGHLGGL